MRKGITKARSQVEELLEYAWLNLDDPSKYDTSNHAFKHRDLAAIEHPDAYLLNILRKPENFSFAAKHIFNVELAPFQAVMQNELWIRKYPMLIATRGGSKTWSLALYAMRRGLFSQGSKVVLIGGAFRQAKMVFEYCENFWRNAPVLRSMLNISDKSQGPHREVDRVVMNIGSSTITGVPIGNGEKIRGLRACVGPNTLVETDKGLIRIKDFSNHMISTSIYTGRNNETEQPKYFLQTNPIDTYRITTTGNYHFDCSDIHKVYTTNGWKLAKDLTTDDALIFENNYKFPNDNVVVDDITIDENAAWLFGILTSEGYLNSGNCVGVKMTDKDCINRIGQAFSLIDNSFNVCYYDTPSKHDSRGWECKPSYDVKVCNKKFRQKLLKCGLEKCRAPFKIIPWTILQSPRSVVVSFLSGLFEGDGTAFIYKDHRKDNNLGVAYYSSSEQLIDELQILLTKLGIFATKGSRTSKLSKKLQYHLRLYGKSAINLVKMLDIPKWVNVISKACLDGKFIGDRKYLKVKSVVKLEGKHTLYDFTIPQSQSFMGNCFRQHNSNLIVDEFMAVPEEIYEVVVAGFASVNIEPVQKMKQAARKAKLKELGLYNEEQHNINGVFEGNQSVIAGTAGYSFQHFAKYWKRYKEIIESKGDKRKLQELVGGEKIPNWKDYSIIRLPYELVPSNFMDEEHIARSQATVHSGLFQQEYCCVFVSDSNGFFKRALIESCVTKHAISLPSGDVQFSPLLQSNRHCRYVMGIDPAAVEDNFAIVILEIYPDHRRIVYCWTFNKKIHQNLVKAQETKETDYYHYCVKKIRKLLRLFPCDRIILDLEGGGRSIDEGLHNIQLLEPGEMPIWRVMDIDDPLDSDAYAGLHMLEYAQFSSAEWTSFANHGMRQDFESKQLLFPYFDPLSEVLALEEDKRFGRVKIVDGKEVTVEDTLENCTREIEELKDELSTIVHSQTGATGRDKWDTPETKLPGNKKGKLRKDRYSALLMANACARVLTAAKPQVRQEQPVGGFITMIRKADKPMPMYTGALTDEMKAATKNVQSYGFVASRGNAPRHAR